MKEKQIKGSIPIEAWGKDHASMLGYVECCCVDKKGLLDGNRVRVNSNEHPVFGDQGLKFRGGRVSNWEDSWRTHIKAGFVAPAYHDDVHVLDELEEHGFVTLVGTMVNPYYAMTKQGLAVAHALREHKANGGSFYQFNWTPFIEKKKGSKQK
jgi:hypothetical protein